jgi:nitronate monooxygenase
MWPDRRLIDLFGIEQPLILAPMAGFGTVELAAAVCDAGGLGSIGCATAQPQLAARTIKLLRQLTSRPINVNFFCDATAKPDADREQAWHNRLSPYYRRLGIAHEPLPSRLDIAPFGDAMCKVVEETRPEVVSFHFGLPTPQLLARIKAAGCRVISSATTVEEAVWLETARVDAIIAQGSEAGGHRATFLAANPNQVVASQVGTFALVPQIVDAVSVPVIAAGGIGDGRGIAAAFALGAAGAQIGTAFLLCPEAATSLLHRHALRRAYENVTVLTNVFTGRPARVLANGLVLDLGPISDDAPGFPLPMGAISLLRATAEQQGNSDFTPLWSGQAAPLATEMPATALMRKLTSETADCLARLRSRQPA